MYVTIYTFNRKLLFLHPIVTSSENNCKPAKKEKRSSSRDLVFRTWTQEMIDNMLTTRKYAMKKKKEEKGTDPVLNMTDIWYDIFIIFVSKILRFVFIVR